MSLILSALDPTKKTLVIIDELGRGTSPEEGVGLAHALAEEIIQSQVRRCSAARTDDQAICFFTTHFLQISHTLSKLYPTAVVPLQFETAVDATARGSQLVYLHRLTDGETDVRHFGLELAMSASLPSSVMSRAREIAAEFDALDDLRFRDAEGTRLAARRRHLAQVRSSRSGALIVQTRTTLQQTLSASKLPDAELRRYLKDIKTDSIRAIAATLDAGPIEA